MTETLTGKQVLALVAQGYIPEIEYQLIDGQWDNTSITDWCISTLIEARCGFRIKPKPQRRLSVTLANGEVVSWPEPVREEMQDGQEYWYVNADGFVYACKWRFTVDDVDRLAFGNIHLTKEAAQEHADALWKINTQGVGK